MNISVLGAGSWGIALTVLLAHNGHQVSVWSIDEDEIKMLKEIRFFPPFFNLPHVSLCGAGNWY